MDELTFLRFLKIIVLVASLLGVLAGLDLLAGAKIISNAKKILDMTFNVDRILIRASSLFRKTMDTYINFDETIVKTKKRIILGVLFIALSGFMFFLIKRS